MMLYVAILLIALSAVGGAFGVYLLTKSLSDSPTPSQLFESNGGRGGDAEVGGDGAAIGGKGGSGGPGGAGGDGGNAGVAGDGIAVGGEGGEAGQLDRGGRGGRSGWSELGIPDMELPDGRWLSDVGKGGDGGGPPRRSLDIETQSLFAQLLRGRLPDGGTAEISVVDLQFRPLAETLTALFETVGWQTTLNKAPVSPHQVKKVQGIGIAGYNEFYMNAVDSIFRSTGFKDTYTELLHSDVPTTHPKWTTIQSKVNVLVGFPRE